MDHMDHERTPLPNVPWLQYGTVTACLQFKMVDGVQPALQHIARSTNMENLPLAGLMEKVDHGAIRSTRSKAKVDKISVVYVTRVCHAFSLLLLLL